MDNLKEFQGPSGIGKVVEKCYFYIIAGGAQILFQFARSC